MAGTKKAFLCVLLGMLIGAVGCLACVIWSDLTASEDHGEFALRQTGLAGDYTLNLVMHGDNLSRDSFSQTFLLVDQHSREGLLREISRAPQWRVAPLPAADFRAFQAQAMWFRDESLQVADATEFDAWYYRETAEPAGWDAVIGTGPLAEIGRVGRGFDFAAYDRDSGLFVYVNQFG